MTLGDAGEAGGAKPVDGGASASAGPFDDFAFDLAQQFWRHSPLMAWVKDAAGRYVYFSKAFLERFGPDTVRWLGKTDEELRSPEAAQVSRQHDQSVLTWRKPVEVIEPVPGFDGKTHHYLVIRFLFTRNRADHIGAVVVDITAQKLQTDEWARLATTDELTGAHNRRGFLLLAQHELRAARRRGTTSALVYVDLDNLKRINDTLGHRQGDLLLIATARLLRSEFRANDIIARIGGDEFTVFAADQNAGADDLRERLEARLLTLRTGADLLTHLSLSIGVALCAPDESKEMHELIALADKDLYRNKAKARDRPAAN